MYKLFLVTFISLVAPITSIASTLDCQKLYVGRITVSKAKGLSAVVFLNNPSNSSGSYWVNFSGWTSDHKKEALSLLMSAKIANHRVNVLTEHANGCGIQEGFTTFKTLYLTTNP